MSNFILILLLILTAAVCFWNSWTGIQCGFKGLGITWFILALVNALLAIGYAYAWLPIKF